MSNKIFTDNEIKKLKLNKYVKNVTNKGITYSNEFKVIVISELDKGIHAKDIFLNNGFNIDILGMSRINSACSRWKISYNKKGTLGLEDTRTNNSGRSRNKELTTEEQLENANLKIELLQMENDLLKKVEKLERQVKLKRTKIIASEKYKIIQDIYSKYKALKSNVTISYLCKVAEVSRTGYYSYFSATSIYNRKIKETNDFEKYKLILKAYKFKNRKKGARQIKMTLEKSFNVIMNLKSIRRIMKKYGLFCPIRKANPYRRMMKATQEHTVLNNDLQRKFKQNIPGKVLLTDITYLFYNNGKKAYLSTIKDGSTNEILAYELSKNLEISIVLNTLKKLKKNRNIKLTSESFIHSDQGVHYTSPKFQNAVKKLNIGQSMSRRGNCWDNAPQESFFGHMKDETNIKDCKNYEELEKEIKDYINYYNKTRGQWNLKKMTPVEFRNHLLAS